MLGKAMAAIILGASLAASHQVLAQESADEGAELDAVVKAVRESLIEAQTNNTPGFPPLKSITLNLQTVATRSGGLQLKFFVFTIGTKHENETASSVQLVMKPPATRSALTMAATVDPGKVKLALAQAINLAKVGVINANKADPPLVMSNIEIELKFAVRVDSSGGVRVTELLPLGIEGTGKLERNKIHTIKLTFGT